MMIPTRRRPHRGISPSVTSVHVQTSTGGQVNRNRSKESIAGQRVGTRTGRRRCDASHADATTTQAPHTAPHSQLKPDRRSQIAAGCGVASTRAPSPFINAIVPVKCPSYGWLHCWAPRRVSSWQVSPTLQTTPCARLTRSTLTCHAHTFTWLRKSSANSWRAD